MKKKFGKVFAATLVLVLFSMMALGSGSDSAEKVGEVSGSSSASSEEASAEKKNETAEPADTNSAEAEPANQQTEFYVGDILKAEGLSIVYVASGEYTSDNQFLQPKEGNKYIYIELAIENTSNSDQTVSSFSFNCYADGYACDSYYGNDDGLDASLSAGRSTTGRVYFEVPENAEKIDIEYEYNILSSKKAIFVYEGEKNSGYVAEANMSASADAFKVGDIVQGNNITMSYLSCQVWESGNQFITPKDGCEFIECEFEFENTGSSDQMVSSFEFNCYADGASCDQCYTNESDLSTTTLSAGRKAKGTVTFEVPKDAAVVELEYTTNFFTSSHAVFTIR